MEKKTKPVFYMLLFSGALLLIFLILQPLQVYFFRHEIPVIFPQGWIALEERNLLLFIQALMLLVIVPVFVLTFIFSWRYRADNKKATYDPDLVDHKIAEIIWWGFPLILVTIIGIVTYYKTHELDPYRPIESDQKPLVIQAVALQWKWLFIYPEEKIATVNYVEIPRNRPVRFLITADAPMNSLWIPSLGGQIYAMPGMQTELNLIANGLGEFRGSSANISGEGFASMWFMTKASEEKEFDEWVNQAQKASDALNFKRYEELAAPSQHEPVKLFRLDDQALFHQIIMKYMEPEKVTNTPLSSK
jgi:cytochrome o ubiquinol oxidase subunit 2